MSLAAKASIVLHLCETDANSAQWGRNLSKVPHKLQIFDEMCGLIAKQVALDDVLLLTCTPAPSAPSAQCAFPCLPVAGSHYIQNTEKR